MGIGKGCIEKTGDLWTLCPKARIIKTTETMIFVSCDRKFCLRKIIKQAAGRINENKSN